LTIDQLSTDEINLILDTTDSMKEISTRDIKKVPHLRGKTVINLFYEPSTRTRSPLKLPVNGERGRGEHFNLQQQRG